MATCGSLRSLFEKPLPENPTLMESLSSWQNQMPKNPLDPASFTEIFGELHFQEKPLASTIFSWKSTDSLQLCTEGLGSESSDDVDDMTNIESDDKEQYAQFKEKMDLERLELSSNNNNSLSLSVKNAKGFPPPIPSIGRSGKPGVCFKAYRKDGRFVLREVRLPNQKEVLRASRQDGRLKLQFACHEEDIIEGEGVEEDIDEEKEEVEEQEVEEDEDMKDEAEMECISSG